MSLQDDEVHQMYDAQRQGDWTPENAPLEWHRRLAILQEAIKAAIVNGYPSDELLKAMELYAGNDADAAEKKYFVICAPRESFGPYTLPQARLKAISLTEPRGVTHAIVIGVEAYELTQFVKIKPFYQ